MLKWNEIIPISCKNKAITWYIYVLTNVAADKAVSQYIEFAHKIPSIQMKQTEVTTPWCKQVPKHFKKLHNKIPSTFLHHPPTKRTINQLKHPSQGHTFGMYGPVIE